MPRYLVEVNVKGSYFVEVEAADGVDAHELVRESDYTISDDKFDITYDATRVKVSKVYSVVLETE